MRVARGWAPARWPTALQAIGLGALAVLLYVPALDNGFVNWDDDRLLLDNAAVTARDGLGRIWSTLELPDDFPNYPLVMTSYWLGYRLWGADPAGYHAVNIILHGINTALVFALLRALGGGAWLASVAAALFGAHPIQVESVAWVAEQKNVLSTMFYLAAFLAFLRHRASGRWGWYAASLVLFAAALMSKTATVVLPLSLLLADRLRDGRWEVRRVASVVPMFLLGAGAAAVTVFAESRPPATLAPAARPLLAASVVWFYVGKLLVPLNLLPIYPRWEVSPGAPQWWLPPFGVLAAGVLVWRWRQPWQARWGVGHFVCTLLPVLGLVPFGYHELSYVADRHVYVASIGLFLVGAIALDRWRARAGRAVAILAAVLILVLGALTWRQIPVWRDSVSLWTYELDHDPTVWVAQNNLAMALIERGRLDEAAELLHAALATRPTYAEAHNNLALVYYRQGAFRAAETHSRQAVALMPYAAGFAKNLGLTLSAQSDLAGAEREFRRALALDPGFADARSLLVEVLRQQGREDDAAKAAAREAAP